MNNFKMRQFINWPNLVTLFALALAWLGIILLFRDKFYLSFIFILLSFIVDLFDGYLARRLNQVSDFGRQLDSQVDVFIYLLYPALAFYWFFGIDSYFSLFIIFLFLAAGIFRLVRFNIVGFMSTAQSDKNYTGLPVVMSHVLVLIFVVLKLINFDAYFEIIADILILAMSFLMLASFPFPKPKNIFWVVLLLLVIMGGLFFLNYHGKN